MDIDTEWKKETLTRYDLKLLIKLHDVHKEVLLARMEGKPFSGIFRRKIWRVCREARSVGFDFHAPVSFKIERRYYVLWPSRLVKSLSRFV